MGKTALLIVDVQTGIFNRKKPVFEPDALINRINGLINKAHNTGSPVVFIQHESSGFLKKNSPGWELHPGLLPGKDDLFIGKKEGNSFFETPLHERLKELNIDRVVVCGLLSGLCVQRTCIGALKLGYETVLVADGHSNMAKEPLKTIEKVHKDIHARGAAVVNSADLFLRN
ncbi:MAG: isochorismatase family protein [Spirochaetales bacterium]|nr:isochorismatase family protein [Spirochaetales bacterium]